MSTSLLDQFSQLEKSTNEFLSQIQGWSDEQLSQKEDENNWSANQVIEHLLSSEMGTLGYMKKKSSSGWDALEDATDETRAAGQALASRLSTNMRIVAPSVLPVPTNQYSFDQLMGQWKVLRTDLKGFIENIKPEHYNKLVFKQPSIGMIHIGATMDFLDAHVRHHIHQVVRIKSVVLV